MNYRIINKQVFEQAQLRSVSDVLFTEEELKEGMKLAVSKADATLALYLVDIEDSFDAVILCCGASNPRDIKAEGRDAKGIYFAVDFLSEVSKTLMDFGYDSKKTIAYDKYSFKSLAGKNVVVIGGGDYLSNESAYRNTLLRDVMGLKIPAGHIHVPVMNHFDGGPDIKQDDNAMTDAVFESYRTAIVGQTTNLLKIIGESLVDK